MHASHRAAASAVLAGLLFSSSISFADGTAPAAPEAKHGSRVPGALITALGVLGLGAGGVFAGLAHSAGSSAREQCPNPSACPASDTDLGRAKGLDAASAVAFASGGAIAALGIVLTITAPSIPIADDAPKSARISPWVGKNGGGVGVSVAF